MNHLFRHKDNFGYRSVADRDLLVMETEALFGEEHQQWQKKNQKKHANKGGRQALLPGN